MTKIELSKTFTRPRVKDTDEKNRAYWNLTTISTEIYSTTLLDLYIIT